MLTARKTVAMSMRYVHTEDVPVRQGGEPMANAMADPCRGWHGYPRFRDMPGTLQYRPVLIDALISNERVNSYQGIFRPAASALRTVEATA